MNELRNLLQDRRVVLAIGGVFALLLGLGIALGIKARNDKAAAPPPASQAGLVVETGKVDDGKLDPARPLRCFVGGQFVGEVTLAECAKRNGVATGALDVGVDSSGQLAAADQAGTTLAPLPPPQTGPASAPVITAMPAPAQTPTAAGSPTAGPGPTAPCWRYQGGEWRRIGETQQGACVATLYNGNCLKRGAEYGRWGEMTLRLVPGKVEISPDNRSFHTLVEQGAGCSVSAG
ncbi:MAG: hypothetical protein JWP35_122 [Caulobacter sp.]|nr:hypothetical protein [Caulobacter sp.]